MVSHLLSCNYSFKRFRNVSILIYCLYLIYIPSAVKLPHRQRIDRKYEPNRVYGLKLTTQTILYNIKEKSGTLQNDSQNSHFMTHDSFGKQLYRTTDEDSAP